VPLNTELSAAGGGTFQAFVPLTSGLLHMPEILGGWPLTGLSEHDGLGSAPSVLMPVALV
jgi:hypothetical protein